MHFFQMKKKLFLFVLFIGLSAAGYSQAAGKGSGEKLGFFKRRTHAQMRHFEKIQKDPALKHNGTAYRKKAKNSYIVDGNGFSNSSGKKRWWKRRKN